MTLVITSKAVLNLSFLNKKWFIVALVLVASVVLAVSIRRQDWKNDSAQNRGKLVQESDQLTEDLIKPSKDVRVIKQDAWIILAAFPAGFPAEAGAQDNAGYKYIPANSLEQQSTLGYISRKTLAENAKIFTDYLSKAGFTIINKEEGANLVFYYATKGNADLSVTVKKVDNKVTVSVSYLKR